MKTRELPAPNRPNAQVKSYLHAYQEGLKARYVMPGSKGWYVCQPPKADKGQLFATKQAAIDQAKKELATTKGELFVFGKNGQITSNNNG